MSQIHINISDSIIINHLSFLTEFNLNHFFRLSVLAEFSKYIMIKTVFTRWVLAGKWNGFQYNTVLTQTFKKIRNPSLSPCIQNNCQLGLHSRNGRGKVWFFIYVLISMYEHICAYVYTHEKCIVLSLHHSGKTCPQWGKNLLATKSLTQTPSSWAIRTRMQAIQHFCSQPYSFSAFKTIFSMSW